jgi:hypothetical protein
MTPEIEKMRAELAEQVSRPGKFEGEFLYSPYYYDCILDGSSDEILDWSNGVRTDIIRIGDTDRDMFPELNADTIAVAIEESETGFVFVSQLNQRELDKLMSAYIIDSGREVD